MTKKELVDLLNQFDDNEKIHFGCTIDGQTSEDCVAHLVLDPDYSYEIGDVHEDYVDLDENEDADDVYHHDDDVNVRHIGRRIVFWMFGDMTYQD